MGYLLLKLVFSIQILFISVVFQMSHQYISFSNTNFSKEIQLYFNFFLVGIAADYEE